MADLSDTAVVLPAQPTAGELSGYLNLMGRLGSLTGYPVLRLQIVRPDGLQAVADRNLLVIGTPSRLGPAADLLKNTPYRVNGDKLDIDLSDNLQGLRRVFGRSGAAGAGCGGDGADGLGDRRRWRVGERARARCIAAAPVVALLGGSTETISDLVAALRDPDQTPQVRGDLALLTGGQFTSYRVGREYTTGSLPFWIYPSWLLRNSPLPIVVLMVAGSALIALFYYFGLRRRAALRSRRMPDRRPPV